MSFQASAVLSDAGRILHDTGNTSWTETELIAWLNDAQYALVSLRPEAYGQTICHLLDAGASQQLDDSVSAVFEIPYNCGDGGGEIPK